MASSLTPTDFNNQIGLSAGKIRKVWPDWQLTHKLEAVQTAPAKLMPKHLFRFIFDLAQFPCSDCFPSVLATHRAAPHPPAGTFSP
jgi:hypothetical protein